MDDSKQSKIRLLQDKLADRHNKNLSFFKNNLPTIFNKIVRSTAMPELEIDPSSLSIQRKINGKVCYQPNAIEYATQETNDFFKLLDHIDYRPNVGSSYLPHLIDKKAFKKSINSFLEDKTLSKKRENTNLDLVIFGSGLGYHVEILLNINRFRSITLIENDIKNFKSTLYTLNWEGILTSLPKNKKVTIILNTDKTSELETEKFLYEIKTLTVNLFPSNTVSSIKYTHEPDRDEHQRAKETLETQTKHFNVLYEKIGPDGQRLLNANENLRLNNPLIKLSTSKINTDRHIAIVGAGPSLDIYSDLIIKNREEFFIFSAGSSLSSLINLGIIPDLHLELEYKVLLSNLISHIASQHSLKQIKLISTVETHPQITKIFGECYHFVPETSEVCSMMPSDSILSGGGVNCVVAALAIANTISPKDKPIFLFGIDFANLNGQHHSKSNISLSENLPENLKHLKIDNKKINRRYNVKVKGNNGEILMTSQVLESSRIAMNDLLIRLRRTVYNCAYGAFLENTTHLSEEELLKKLSNSHNKSSVNNIEIFINQYDYKTINNECIKLLTKALSISNEIHSVLMKNRKLDYEEIINLIYQINHEINTIKSLQQRRLTYSINRLPIYLLYILANFSSEERRSKLIEIWCKDYKKYISIVNNSFLGKLKDKSHLLNEEWTDMKTT